MGVIAIGLLFTVGWGLLVLLLADDHSERDRAATADMFWLGVSMGVGLSLWGVVSWLVW